MLKALISITAALAIFAAGSAMVTKSSLAMGQASGAEGKSTVPKSPDRVKTAKGAGKGAGDVKGSASSPAGSAQTSPGKQ
jgi:hypothetical protein